MLNSKQFFQKGMNINFYIKSTVHLDLDICLHMLYEQMEVKTLIF